MIEKRVSVPISTVWTTNTSPRPIDQLITEEPYRFDVYLATMSYEDRLQLCTDNLAQTQLLFNDRVEVLNEENGWSEIIIPDQPTVKHVNGYPGWVPSRHLAASNHVNSEQSVLITSQTAWLYTLQKQRWLHLSFGTTFEVTTAEDDWIRVRTPLGEGYMERMEVSFQQFEKNGTAFLTNARRFLGLPYLWAGMSGFGFDCSGFVYRMYKSSGIILPRDASNQFQTGIVINEKEMEQGDLLYFAYDEGAGSVHHVAMYAGNGKIIHAPKTGKNVEEIALSGTIYDKELCGVRRFSSSSLWEVNAS
ncbi:C40 family peptidase [Bacillus sp. Marseille-P3800]|uniref:C40 family peptidase n=1 Tax=Bacillus sp. Marseille-P3800 TaxID=2014782 RepID=UPI000C086A00|nr:C40 family peptidase [Bacillus sp. Marseille-P3800]